MNSSSRPEESLYAATPRIHPRAVSGVFARMRTTVMVALLGLYYLLPWLQWNGRPLVLFDLPARRFHLFGMTLFPQDLFLLTWLLIIAAVSLFLFTTLAGRLWCGYACPQTVWTEAFLWLERHIEGDRHQRIKLDKSPWNTRKILRRGGRNLAWILFAAWTGISFVGFFVPIRELISDALHWQLGGWALFWSVFYGFATWGNAGFMREQVCKYMCPYARFQSAMFDRNTLIVAYDDLRGEPRKGLAKKNRANVVALQQATAPAAAGTASLSPAAIGDCVDCSLCVQVCPTGIDIRDGLQYECIACASCVDACNSVMDQVGKPRGLIRYTSSEHDRTGKFRLLRGRTIGYGIIWTVLVVGFLVTLALRSSVNVDVIRDRTQLYRELSDGRISNVFTLKIENKTELPQRFSISAQTHDGKALTLDHNEVTVDPVATLPVTLSATLPRDEALPAQSIRFRVQGLDDPQLHDEQESRFFGAAP